MGTTDEVVALREQVADLTLMLAGQGKKREYEERVERLALLGLTKLQAKMVASFNGPGIFPDEKILSAVYWDRFDEQPDGNVLKVHICKIRRKLEKHGVKILNIWGVGYQIDPACYSIFRRLIEPKETDDGRKEEKQEERKRVSCSCSQ